MTDYRVVTTGEKTECQADGKTVMEIKAGVMPKPEGMGVDINIYDQDGERHYVMSLAYAHGKIAIEINEDVLEAMFKATPVGVGGQPSRVVVVP